MNKRTNLIKAFKSKSLWIKNKNISTTKTRRTIHFWWRLFLTRIAVRRRGFRGGVGTGGRSKKGRLKYDSFSLLERPRIRGYRLGNKRLQIIIFSDKKIIYNICGYAYNRFKYDDVCGYVLNRFKYDNICSYAFNGS